MMARRETDMGELKNLVHGYVEADLGAGELHARFVKNVDRVTRRYPDCYFELGRRTPEAIEDLADRVFTVCARVEKGRFPFMGRVPFRCFVDEDMEDRPIRYHSFDARLSITREILRDDYAFNIRRDPVLKWRDALHREIGKALPEVAQEMPGGPGANRRWAVPLTGPRVVRSVENIQRRLGSVDNSTSVPELLTRVLSLAGQPLSHSQLSTVLAQLLGGPSESEPLESPPEDLVQRMTVRRAVLSAWDDLNEDEQALLIALVQGVDYDTLIARVPRFKDRTAVSRAVKRVSQGFVMRVLAASGVEDPASVTVGATPKQLVERIAEVLLPVVPALSAGIEEAS